MDPAARVSSRIGVECSARLLDLRPVHGNQTALLIAWSAPRTVYAARADDCALETIAMLGSRRLNNLLHIAVQGCVWQGLDGVNVIDVAPDLWVRLAVVRRVRPVGYGTGPAKAYEETWRGWRGTAEKPGDMSP